MKKSVIYFWIVCVMFTGTGCENFLYEEHEVRPTTNFLFTTPEGLSRAVTAMYSYARRIVFEGESGHWVGMDLGTDIILYRGGTAAALGTYNNLTFSNTNVEFYWDHFYYLIGRANEVIYYAENNMDQDDPVVKQAVAEAKVFRAESYFYLIRKFDKVWLNIIPTTPDNYDDTRDFTPDDTKVFDLIKQDLDDAIGVLDSAVIQTGRYTKGAARHIKAKVAMWLSDWDEAIKQVEAIRASNVYELLLEPKDVFADANLNHKEAIFTFQFERGAGGGGNSTGNGHRMSLIFTPAYGSEPGMQWSFEYGCYGWGRIYPNSYLLNMFDKANDKRYTQYFQHEYRYNNPNTLPAGKNIGDIVSFTSSTYLTRGGHTHCTKFTDYGYTTLAANATTSFKDVIVYRLAETWLMGAEAYFHKNGGDDPNAKWYFSEIRKRAGLGEFTGTLTLDLILEEHGKELLFEGDRWFMLKRLGLLVERVKLYAGDDRNVAVQQTFLDARNNIKDYHIRWPIPQSARDQMGDAFPQNTGYEAL
jgi:hypothetical protein